MPHLPAAAALAPYRVLDLTRVRAGPACVRQLADWGADVIKVEMPVALEGDNQTGGPRHGSDFQNLHRNKRSITLNLKEAEGQDIFFQLVDTADVVVENYRPDVKYRLGIDYETLAGRNAKIVYASISGFGQDGPYAKRAGFDQIAQGLGGLMSITGAPGEGPMRVGIPVADLTAGQFAAQGILLALLTRERTGQGQWVDTSLLQAQIFMLDFQGARWLVEGEIAEQAGNDHPTSIPTGVFPTQDGYINIAATGQVMWRRLCASMEAPEWLEDPRFADGEKRSENRQALNRAIAARSVQKSTQVWIEQLNAAGIPSGPINRIDQAFEDPQVQHLNTTASVASPSLGAISLLAQPMRLSNAPTTFSRPPPEPGEHNDEILSELGYSESQREALRARNVI